MYTHAYPLNWSTTVTQKTFDCNQCSVRAVACPRCMDTSFFLFKNTQAPMSTYFLNTNFGQVNQTSSVYLTTTLGSGNATYLEKQYAAFSWDASLDIYSILNNSNVSKILVDNSNINSTDINLISSRWASVPNSFTGDSCGALNLNTAYWLAYNNLDPVNMCTLPVFSGSNDTVGTNTSVLDCLPPSSASIFFNKNESRFGGAYVGGYVSKKQTSPFLNVHVRVPQVLFNLTTPFLNTVALNTLLYFNTVSSIFI